MKRILILLSLLLMVWREGVGEEVDICQDENHEWHFHIDNVAWYYKGKEYDKFEDIIIRILIKNGVGIMMSIEESQAIWDDIYKN